MKIGPRGSGTRAKFLLKLAVSLGLVAWLAFTIPWSQVGASLLAANKLWIAFGYAQMLMITVLQALRWKLMLRIPGLPVSKYLHFIFVGLFYRVILPGSLSADMLKVVLFGRKYNKPLHESGLVFFCQLLGMILQWSVGIVGLFYFGRPLLDSMTSAEVSWRKLALLGGAAALAAFALPFIPAVRLFAGRMLKAVREALSTKGVLTNVILATLGIQLLTISSAYCIFWGAGVEIPLLFLCFQMALAITLTSLPISINGLGVVDFLNLFLLQRTLGESVGDIMAVSVVSYSMLILNALLGGAWILYRNATAKEPVTPE